jgi:hypothetical protein
MEQKNSHMINHSVDPCLPKFLRRKDKDMKIKELNLTIHKPNKEEYKFVNNNDVLEDKLGKKFESSSSKAEYINDNFLKMLNKLKKIKKDEKIHRDISDLKVFLQEKFNLVVDIEDYKNYYNINEFDLCNCTGKKQHLLNCLINKKYNRFLEENIISKEMIDYQSWINIRQRFYEYFPAKNIERNLSAKAIKREKDKIKEEKVNKTIQSNESFSEKMSKMSKDEVKINENLFSHLTYQINQDEEKTLEKLTKKLSEKSLGSKENEKKSDDDEIFNPDSRDNLYRELVNKKLKVKNKKEKNSE